MFLPIFTGFYQRYGKNDQFPSLVCTRVIVVADGGMQRMGRWQRRRGGCLPPIRQLGVRPSVRSTPPRSACSIGVLRRALRVVEANKEIVKMILGAYLNGGFQCFPKMSVASAAAFMLRVGHACRTRRTQVMLPLEPKYFNGFPSYCSTGKPKCMHVQSAF